MKDAPATDVSAKQTSKERLIASAETLFGERGFDGVSVRDIATDAGVNSALVGYYFGGKEGLLAEVYTRHSEPMRAERTRLLRATFASGVSPSLEQILDAFIRPSMEATQSRHGSFTRLRALLSVENSSLLEQLVTDNFDQSSKLFIDALSRCLPGLRREDVLWRFHFLLGGIYYSATGPNRVRTLSRGRCDPSDPVAAREELIAFAAAGFRAPGTGVTRKKATAKRAKTAESGPAKDARAVKGRLVTRAVKTTCGRRPSRST